MPIEIGRIVYSKAGRDKDSFFVTVGFSGQKILLCDGKSRRLEKPKQKSLKHIGLTNHTVGESKLETNKSIRHALNDFKVSNT